jgi:uncharacterized SAM-binding protein YcdF (DUF218 family)
VERLAVIVLGSSLAGTRRRLVRRAERVAAELDAGVVVLTGESEARLMRMLWRGPETTEVVCEDTARTTAENAARSLPLLLARGVTDAAVICAPAHLLRARWIFRRIYGDRGIRLRFRPSREVPTPGGLLWEIAALAVAARQVRVARADRTDP